VGNLNPAHHQVIDLVRDNPNTYSYTELADKFSLTYDQVTSAIRRAQHQYTLQVKKDVRGPESSKRPIAQRKEYIPPPPNTKTVLVIGDTHEPFTLKGYREFCHHTADKYHVTHVIFIGDLIDNHYASFHTSDPDGLGGGNELDHALDEIAKWEKCFRKADVVLGNHDRIIMRKMFEGGIPRRWMMSYQDLMNVPGWNFQEDFTYDGVQYLHGDGATARARARKDLSSTVQGHRHPEAYVDHIVGNQFHIFGMQVGCGIDRKSYAMAYAKNHPKPAIACGIIAEHGRLPINIFMDL
jgi:hypothetical protein